MRRGSLLFGDLARLDFVKCDVEGYETEVLPEMAGVIAKHRPILQVETEGESRAIVAGLLSELGYRAFVVRGARLLPLDRQPDAAGDVIFVPPERMTELSRFLSE